MGRSGRRQRRVAKDRRQCADRLHCFALQKEGRSRKKLTAVLDYGAGVEYEGETAPERSEDDDIAIRGWNMLSGNGCIDWAGLPLVVELLGVADLETFIHRLMVIKTHKPTKE